MGFNTWITLKICCSVLPQSLRKPCKMSLTVLVHHKHRDMLPVRRSVLAQYLCFNKTWTSMYKGFPNLWLFPAQDPF